MHDGDGTRHERRPQSGHGGARRRPELRRARGRRNRGQRLRTDGQPGRQPLAGQLHQARRPGRPRQHLLCRRRNDAHADDRHRPAPAGQPDRVLQRRLPRSHAVQGRRRRRPQLPLPAGAADGPPHGGRSAPCHRRAARRRRRHPELQGRRHPVLERPVHRPDLRPGRPAAVLLRVADGHLGTPPEPGIASAGAEDGGDRPADGRHGARLQQPAAGHQRQPGSRPDRPGPAGHGAPAGSPSSC